MNLFVDPDQALNDDGNIMCDSMQYSTFTPAQQLQALGMISIYNPHLVVKKPLSFNYFIWG